MDPVYQDELILGFQSMLDDKWSWGVRGIYRKLNNAIDDMEITSTGILCDGEPVGVGFVMGNPGEPLTVFTDTNCDGENDAFVTIDTSKAGWAMFDDDGNYVGERGYPKPKRNYKALEFMIDRAWDDRWSLNATYTLSFSKGNAEGPVNSDTDFARRRPHRGLRQSVGELRRRTATCRTTAATSSRCAAPTRSTTAGRSARR